MVELYCYCKIIDLLKLLLIISGFEFFYNYEQFDTYIRREDYFCHCTFCDKYKNRSVTNVRYHVEAKHFPGTFLYPCSRCNKNFNSKTSYLGHGRYCKWSSNFLLLFRKINVFKSFVKLFWLNWILIFLLLKTGFITKIFYLLRCFIYIAS